MRAMLLCGLTLCLTSVASTAKTPDVYGPEPGWDRFRELAEPAVLAKLPDPGNWSIRWPNGYTKSGWRHKGRFPGYLTCGRLIARTPPSKGNAVVNFVVVIDYDRVQTVDISTRETKSLVNVMCQDLVSRGVLPPASLMQPQDGQRSVASLGFKFRAVPQGAEVTEVNEGSVADRAGIRTGMVLSQANGIELAGLGDAVANILGSGASSMRLKLATGETFVIGQ